MYVDDFDSDFPEPSFSEEAQVQIWLNEFEAMYNSSRLPSADQLKPLLIGNFNYLITQKGSPVYAEALRVVTMIEARGILTDIRSRYTSLRSHDLSCEGAFYIATRSLEVVLDSLIAPDFFKSDLHGRVIKGVNHLKAQKTDSPLERSAKSSMLSEPLRSAISDLTKDARQHPDREKN